MTPYQWAELSFAVAVIGIPVYVVLAIWGFVRGWLARRRARQTLAAIDAMVHAYLIHGTSVLRIHGDGRVENIAPADLYR